MTSQQQQQEPQKASPAGATGALPQRTADMAAAVIIGAPIATTVVGVPVTVATDIVVVHDLETDLVTDHGIGRVTDHGIGLVTDHEIGLVNDIVEVASTDTRAPANMAAVKRKAVTVIVATDIGIHGHVHVTGTVTTEAAAAGLDERNIGGIMEEDLDPLPSTDGSLM